MNRIIVTIEAIDGVGSRDMGMVYEAIREQIEFELRCIGVKASVGPPSEGRS